MTNERDSRFKNTLADLKTCSHDLYAEGYATLVSESERTAAAELFSEAQKFIRNYNAALEAKHSNAIEDVDVSLKRPQRPLTTRARRAMR